MSEGQRPGGLTALAVINFVWGGLSCLGVLVMAAFLALGDVVQEGLEAAAEQETDPAAAEQAAAMAEMGEGLFTILLVLSAVSAFLLIASGVGYLKQKKFLGRTLGNAYALFSILSGLGSALVMGEALGGGFNIGTIIGLVYPVLTLALLNGTFKEDFIH